MLNCAFTGRATSLGGRSGKVSFGKNPNTTLETTMPPDLGGSADRQGTNPEELFGAGISSGFYGSIFHTAHDLGLEGWDKDAAVTADVNILFPEDRSYYRLGVTLHVRLPSIDTDTARQLIRAAKEVNGYWELLEKSGMPLAVTLNGSPIDE
jgi:osmotically inducible protein OsmC